MADNFSEKRRLFVMALARRFLDFPDNAPTEDLKSALTVFGVDADRAVERTNAFIKHYTQELLQQTKLQHDAELQAFSEFQQRYASYTVEELQLEIHAKTHDVPGHVSELHSYYRDLKERTSDDAKSELLDLLWEIHKLTIAQSK
jgi:hypothetical protein